MYIIKLKSVALKVLRSPGAKHFGVHTMFLSMTVYFPILFYFVVSHPSKSAHLDAVQQLPGTLTDEMMNNPDDLVLGLIQCLPRFKSLSKRVLLLFLGWWLLTIISYFIFFLPFILGYFVIAQFGLVWAVTSATSALMWLASFLAAASVAVDSTWSVAVRKLVRLVEPMGGEEFKGKVDSIIVRWCGYLNKTFDANKVLGNTLGCDWTINKFLSSDLEVSDRFAALTYILYCPRRSRVFMNVFWVCVFWALLLARVWYSMMRRAVRSWWLSFKLLLIFVVVVTTCTDSFVDHLLSIVYWSLFIVLQPVNFVLFGSYRRFRYLLKLCLIKTVLWTLNQWLRVEFLTATLTSDVKGLNPTKHKLRAFFNNSIMDVSKAIDGIALPNFIRSIPDRFDRETINEANEILTGLGWPEAPIVTEIANEEPKNFSQFASEFIGGTSIRQGVARMELEVSQELLNLKGFAPEYKRTEQYATIESELDSLSRYFVSGPANLPDLSVNEIWVLVGVIFQASRLTPFSYIIKKWEKKYGLGPFWGEVKRNGKWRKLSRKKFIQSIGGMANFVKLWATTFEQAHTLVPVAGVSVKSEALPERKWRNDIVRTVISAPLVHYISSTIWNYHPNHNFKFWSSSIKIGMPLNGFNLSKLVADHDNYDFHFAGDFEAFDSTVSKDVTHVIAKVRKKGFERHRDYAKICFLIDANYKNLDQMPLMTTSTGNIYRKQGGLSTGHSSTSLDNSLAVVIYYLCAWKKLTGLSAHEFRHYCKLSNYGDDHLLSWLASAPSNWSSGNIIKCMARMNVRLKDEEPSGELLRMTFLSKGWRHPTTADSVALSQLGIKVPRFIVIHDTRKLIGKAYAPAKGRSSDRAYRIKRLTSYMGLCAHQPDVYDKLAEDIKRFEVLKNGSTMQHNIKVPTYAQVMLDWYKPDARILEEDEPIPEDEKGEIIDYSMDGLADTICNIVSVIPDVLNPIIYNIGYTTYLTSLFGTAVSWPVELLRRSNTMLTTAGLTQLMKRTCYDFLADNPRLVTVQNDEPDSALLTRHWAYMCCLPSAKKAFGFFVWAGYLDKKLAELNFVLNGYVQPYVKRVDVPLAEILVIAALSILPGLPIPTFVKYIRIPAFSNVIEMVYSYVLNNIWGKVPANMKQTAAAIELLGPECPSVLVEAPTGTGKSTTFINYVYRYFGHKYTRVILVVPRNLLVTTLTPYLNDAFALPAHPVTSGCPFDPGKRLIVTTPQEVLLHERWLTEGNLFIIDEAHVDEAPVRAVIHILKKLLVPAIYTTATPTQFLKEESGVHVPLQIAMTWTITEDVRPAVSMPEASYSQWWRRYRADVLGLVRTRNLSKFLIFVVDQAHALELAQVIGKRVCILTSRDKEIDSGAQVFIASAVADVGLTLPNVDWVITSNVTRCQLPGHNSEVVALVSLPYETVKQRRGRTGRTNNGLFTYFRYKDMPFLKEMTSFDNHTTGVALLLGGADPKIVAKFYPEVVAALFKESYTRELDPKIDKFVEALSRFHEVADVLHQRTFKRELDSAPLHNYWTVQGNTIPTVRRGVDDAGRAIGQPLQAEEAAKFMVGASAWLASQLEDLPLVDHLVIYLRENIVGSDTFKDKIFFYKDWVPYTSGRYEAVSGSTYGRFGKTTFPTNRPSQDDINEGFEFW